MRQIYLLMTVIMIGFSTLYAQDNMRYDDYLVADFEDLALDPDSYWNGSDESGGFTSGPAWFLNDYNPEWMSWSGFSYSNMADDSTAGFLNQYSAITARGYDPAGSGGPNYAVSYVLSDFVTFEPIPVTIHVTDPGAKAASGLYVTNSTIAALSMEFGDDYAKKFGGETGEDPDWFMLTVKGYQADIETGAVEFYLADFRFANNEDDYILKTWEWVDLASLGEVDSLKFFLSSSDTGTFGMNTPAYFCLDNLTFTREYAAVHAPGERTGLQVYPNPSNGQLRINADLVSPVDLSVYDLAGRRVFSQPDYVPGELLDIRGMKAGRYVIRLQSDTGVCNSIIILNQGY